MKYALHDLHFAGLRIRIRIGSGFSDIVYPDPYWESGSMGKKIEIFLLKNAFFSIFAKILSSILYKNTLIFL
jgi:hypothetical protein